MNRFHRIALLCSLLVIAPWVSAQTSVTDPWIRGTVPQQKATGLFVKVTSVAGGKLVAASTPVAALAEIHEMSMDGDVMKMRAVAGIDLPPGQTVELKPGGYHVMLFELKQQLKPGDFVPVALVVQGKDGKRETVEFKAEVRAMAASPEGIRK